MSNDMGLPKDVDEEVIILGVDFAEGNELIEIRFVERRNVAPSAFKQEVLTVGAELLDDKEEIKEVLDTLKDWVDTGLRHLRVKGGEE